MKSTLQSTLLVVFCLSAIYSFGQCPPPGFPQTTSSCPTANLVCDLDGYCNLINNSNVSQNFPGCSGNVLNNDEWFAFYAATTSITLVITPSNCLPSNGQLGMQGAIYGACGGASNSSWQIMDTQCACLTSNITLNATNFVVGQIYYVVFDGCSGSVCNYSVDVTVGSTQAPAPNPPAVPAGPMNVCANGNNVTYTIPPVPYATGYTWTLDPAVGTITPNGAGTSATVSFPPGTSGPVQVCVTAFNGCYPAGPPTCKTINVIPLPTATLSGSGAVCQNNATPIPLTVDFTGTGPWTFVYAINGVNQPAITTSTNPYTINATQIGNYTLVSVFNNQGIQCNGTVSGTAAITQLNVTLSAQTTPSTCGEANGSINLTVGGSAPGPYTYNWSNMTSDPSLTNVVGGMTYQVTVTSANGCTQVLNTNLPNSQVPITVTGTTTPNTACSSANGSISVTLNPPNATYTWSNGATTLNPTDLPAGTYTITATIGVTCTQTQSFTIANTPNTPNATLTPTGTTCSLDNGAVNLSVTGGVSPYTYLWSNGSTDPNLTNVLAGPFTVTVTGSNGCTTTATTNVTNTNPPINVTGVVTNNTTCAPTGNGAINISISPAGTYTYNWSTPSTDEDQANLSPGAYTVTVTGQGACTGTASFNIANTPVPPVATLTPTGTTCNLDNGAVNLSVSGGTPPYTYLWSNGSTDPNLPNIMAGPYSVTVTDANMCTGTASTTVTNSNPPINVTGIVTNNTTCAPTGNGAINITVSPAGTYTYNWSTPSTDEDQTDLSSGTYIVTVTGQGSCTGSASFTITNIPNPPVVNITAINTTCELDNGSVTITVSGGVTPYTYLWSNGSTDPNLTNIIANNYTVTVTGANDCTATASTNVGNTNPPIGVTGVVTPNTTCLPPGNGSINITVNPAGTYTYNWSTPSTDEDQIDLPPGNYSVTVTGQGACTGSANFSIADNPNLPTAALTAVNAICGVGNGSVNLTVSGGVSPYTYLWSTGSTDPNLTNLTPGNYGVVVTGANGCTTTADIDVNDNTPAINISGNTTPNTTCNGGNGSITINITPANPNYVITWSGGLGSGTSQTNLDAGSYTVTVTLGNTCSAEATFTVPDNPAIPDLSANVIDAVCELPNGSITVTPLPGPSPYSYLWSTGSSNASQTNLLPGNYSVVVTGANGCTQVFDYFIGNDNPPISILGTANPNTSCIGANGSITLNILPAGIYTYMWSSGQNTQNITGLNAGTYTVTVFGQGACQEIGDFEVDLDIVTPVIGSNFNNPTCGLANGSIGINVSGGQSPYTYAWTGASGTTTINNLPAGNYSVTATDANGCTDSYDFVLDDEFIDITVGIDVFNVTNCTPPNGGINLTLFPAGLSLQWGHTTSTSTSLSNLSVGTYSVTVSAGGTCTTTETIFVDDNTELPALTITPTAATCGATNGSVSLNVQFGDTPYTYHWSNNATTQNLTNVAPGTYAVTVTTASGCTDETFATVINNNTPISLAGTTTPNTSCTSPNGAVAVIVTPPSANYTYAWSNMQNTASLVNIAAGTYTITVSAGPTCTAVSTFTVPNNATSPSLTGSTISASCGLPNGSINLTSTGTLTPFAYAWTPAASTEDLMNIAAGTYTVTVTNAGNCTATAQFAVGATSLTLDITGAIVPNTSCSSPNGNIAATVSPAGTYTYAWSSGSSTNNTLSGLNTGIYTVTVGAGGTCNGTATFVVTEATTPPNLAAAVTASICNDPNGAIDLTATGPNIPFQYAWTGTNLSGTVSSEDLSNLLPGVYHISVTDATGCSNDTTINVPNNASNFSLAGVATQYTSCLAPNGAINLTVTPAGTYTFTWNDGVMTEDRTGLVAGTYTVAVVETGTCVASISFEIEDQRTQPIISLATDADICGTMNGAIDATIQNAALPVTYLWTGGSSTEDLANLTAGTYTITVTDANQCTATASETINAQDIPFDISGVAVPNTSCAAPNGSISISLSPSTPGSGFTYNYKWSNMAITPNINNLNSGNYTLTVTVGNTCTNTATYPVANQAGAPNLSASTTEALCGSPSGTLNLTVTDGLAPFTYAWSNMASTEDLSNLLPGNYAVTVTDANSCAATGNWDISNQALLPTLAGTTGPNTSCAAPNGSAQVTVSPANPGPGLTYAYLWSNMGTNSSVANLGAGTYTVTVSAGVGCTNSAELTVANLSGAPDLAGTTVAAVCGNMGGSIQLSVTNGLAPYTFKWSNMSTLEDPTGIASGTYTVTVTDANSCTTTASYIVGSNILNFLAAGAPSPNTSCASPNGAITASANPPLPAGSGLTYSYLWSNLVSTATISNLNAGTYTVTVTAGVGCTSSAEVIVLNQAGAPDLTAAPSPALCSNAGGSINLSISGGLAPYTQAWSNSTSLEDPVGLVPGSYTVTVTDANSCTVTATYAVTTTTFNPIVTVSPTASTSCASPNGAISISVNPTMPPGPGLTYSYAWSTLSNTQNQTNLPAGIYTVTVSAGIGCTGTISTDVLSQLDLPALTAITTPALCGNTAGAINLSISSGLAPYSVLWSNLSVSEDLTNLLSDDYSVTVTDANGCQGFATYTVAENSFTPVITAATQSNTSCASPNGAIQLSVSPNTSTYTYIWASGANTPTRTNLIAGNYYVTVSAGGGCTAVQTITVPDASGAPAITGIVVDLLCFGDNIGEIDITLTGGQTPFTYGWSAPGLGNNPNPTGLSAGSYVLTVTDGLGCSSEAAFVVNGPSSPVTINCFQTQQVSAPGATDGAGRINISGGVSPYKIDWNPGGGSQANFAGGAFNLSNLAEGIYMTTVTDANGCTAICSFPISQQGCETMLGTLSSTATDVCGPNCITLTYDPLGQFLDADDILQFILYNGTAGSIGTEIKRSTNPSFCFDPAIMQYGTTYYIAVAAGNNDGTAHVDLMHFCTVVSTGTPVMWKREPIAAIAPVSPLNCVVRQVSLTGSSSIPLSTFSWAASSGGTIVGAPTAAIIQASSMGNYQLIVKVNGCADTTAVQVNDISNEPIAGILAQPGDLLDCVIDSIELNGTIEGTLAPQFVWTVNNQFYANGTAVVVDNPGTYQFILTDTISLCADTANITIQTNQNFPLLFAPNPDTLTCLVNSVTLIGSSPFSNIGLKWGKLVGPDTLIVSNTATAQVSTAGTYLLIGTDLINNCVNSISVDVIADQNAPNANAGQDVFIKCYGDTVTLNGSGSTGIGILSYQWSTTSGHIQSGPTSQQPLVDAFGAYTLVVTQLSNGCTNSDIVDLLPLPIEAEVEVKQPVCEGEKGAIQISNPTGVPPVRYSINGGQSYGNSTIFTQLAPGTYTILMLDAEGCSGEVSGTVVAAPPFILTLNGVATISLGDTYQMQPILNVPPSLLSLIQWTPDTFLTCSNCLNPIASPYHTTQYQLLVKDLNGCERTAPIRLEVDRELVLEVPNVFNPGTLDNAILFPFANTKTLKQIDLMRIYTRWGEQIFEQRDFPPNDPSYGWDGTFRGKDLNPAVFVWYLEATFIDGTKRLYKGDVTLVR